MLSNVNESGIQEKCTCIFCLNVLRQKHCYVLQSVILIAIAIHSTKIPFTS